MGSLPFFAFRAVDTAGAPINGAKLYFYQTGTQSAKNTYSNKALTNANANPVVSDSAGLFGEIYLLQDEGYRVVLKDADDAPLFSADSVFANSFAYDELTRRRSIVRSPMDHSAVGDGSTDDAVALAAALAAASGVLDLEGKTYRCDSTLTLRSGIIIRNGTIDFSNAAISSGLNGTGSAGSPTSVSSATAGGQTITAAGHSNYVAGDLIRLRSSDEIATNHLFAELFRVEQTSGDNIVVDGAILGTYSTSPVVEEITPISDFVLEDLTVIAPSAGYAIDLTFCERVRMRNVHVKCTAAAESIRILSCYGVVMEGCSIRQKTTTEAGGIIIGDASRDVLVTGCHIERALQAIEVGGGYTSPDGFCRDIRIENNRLTWCGQIELSYGSRYVEVLNNTILCDIAPSTASTAAILSGGGDIKICGNTIRDPEGIAIAITQLVSCDYVIVADNTIVGGETHGISVTNTAFTVQALRIDGNEIHEVAGSYIVVSGTASTLLSVSGNTCIGGTGTGVAVDINSSDQHEDVRVCGNPFIDCGTTYTHGIRLVEGGSEGSGRIDGNTIVCSKSDASQVGILSTSTSLDHRSICNNAIHGVNGAGSGEGPGIGIDASGDAAATSIGLMIAGNQIELDTASATAGIRVSEGNRVTIAKNQILITGANGFGIQYTAAAAGCNGVSIIDNTVRSADHCITVTVTDAGTGTHVVVATNNCLVSTSGGASDYALLIDGSSNSGGGFSNVVVSGNLLARSDDDGPCVAFLDIDAIAISGNTFARGTYGFSIDAGSTEVLASNNVYTGQTTGDYNGTIDNVVNGFIPLDITTVKLPAANVIINTTEGGLPDGDTTPILERVNGATDKALRLTWAATVVSEVQFAPVPLPPDLDLDHSNNVTVNLLIAKSANTDSAAVIDVQAWSGVGDTEMGGNTSALSTASVTEYAVTLTGANVGAHPGFLNIQLVPGTHNNDAIYLYAAWIEYASKRNKA